MTAATWLTQSTSKVAGGIRAPRIVVHPATEPYRASTGAAALPGTDWFLNP